MAKTVLLAGATGLVGGNCLRQLIDSNFYTQIIVIVRRPLAAEFNHPKIKQIIVDFNDLPASRSMLKADHIICALGTTLRKAGSKEEFYKVDFIYPYELARVGKEAGAEHFLLITALGANSESGVFYNRVKGDIENAVRTLNYRSLSIFRPSFLTGDRSEFRPGELVAKFFGTALSFMIPAKYKLVSAKHVASAILKVGQENKAGLRIVESDEIQQLLTASLL